ncbi:hypothetical protein Tco_1123237 [Tanacetum coccineum]|uniref:Uncharacterized protein n=1 Tax=Tanacetum coccineum TaxID=301880 RepID=A0ABQ5J2S8_9ASTR
MGKELLGSNGGSGGTIEGKFGEHCGGNNGIGGSKFGVGEGKVESMGGIRGGAFAIHSIVSKDGQGGGGLMERGDVSLDSWVGASRGEVNGGGVYLGVGGDEVCGLLKQHGLTLTLAIIFKLALFSLGIVTENDENEVTNNLLL